MPFNATTKVDPTPFWVKNNILTDPADKQLPIYTPIVVITVYDKGWSTVTVQEDGETLAGTMLNTHYKST